MRRVCGWRVEARLLNFFLKYLKSNEEKRLNGQWVHENLEPFEQFESRQAPTGVTAGIFMSVPIVVNGVAVVLMDTQGLKAARTEQDDTVIFSLSSQVSSVVILNVGGNISEAELRFLQLSTGFGSQMQQTEKTFVGQKLIFLVRDWRNSKHYPLWI